MGLHISEFIIVKSIFNILHYLIIYSTRLFLYYFFYQKLLHCYIGSYCRLSCWSWLLDCNTLQRPDGLNPCCLCDIFAWNNPHVLKIYLHNCSFELNGQLKFTKSQHYCFLLRRNYSSIMILCSFGIFFSVLISPLLFIYMIAVCVWGVNLRLACLKSFFYIFFFKIKLYAFFNPSHFVVHPYLLQVDLISVSSLNCAVIRSQSSAGVYSSHLIGM